MMFVLDWTAYPFIALTVAVPMAVFYVIERRRELREDREYDTVVRPCMAHVSTDTDGTELWCWQRAGHSGPHDDYDTDRVTDGIRRLLRCTEIGCLLDFQHDGPHGSFDTDDEHVDVTKYGDEHVDVTTYGDEQDVCFCGADHASPDFSHDQMTEPLPELPPRLSHVPPQGVCGIELGIDSRCVWAPGHLGECSDF